MSWPTSCSWNKRYRGSGSLEFIGGAVYIIGMQDNKGPLIRFIEDRQGYIRLKEWKAAGYGPLDLKALHQQGVIVKIKNGLYRLAAVEESTAVPRDFIDAALALPDGILALSSALHYYGLIQEEPPTVMMAVPHNRRVPRICSPRVQVFYFRDRFYSPGIEIVDTPHGPVRIYSQEKALCDTFRYRKRLGEKTALEALNRYVKSNQAKGFSRLRHFAQVCQVKQILPPYLRAMVYSL